jgi:hypothetical protein
MFSNAAMVSGHVVALSLILEHFLKLLNPIGKEIGGGEWDRTTDLRVMSPSL